MHSIFMDPVDLDPQFYFARQDWLTKKLDKFYLNFIVSYLLIMLEL